MRQPLASPSLLRESALRTLQIEQAAIGGLQAKLDESFDRACELILACQGRVVVTGMGKSGHIAGKLAATLASTGTPAFFVHPGEASHGDLGMITRADVVLALSNSGETAEVTALLPLLKRLGTPLVSMTGRPTSTLATHADAHLNSGVEREEIVVLVRVGRALVALSPLRHWWPPRRRLPHRAGVRSRHRPS